MYKKLQSFSDEKLIQIFEKLYKSSPHKRIAREFILIAVARKLQTIMTKNILGFVPKNITDNNVKFMSSHEVYLHKQKAKKTNLQVHMCQKDMSCNYVTRDKTKKYLKKER